MYSTLAIFLAFGLQCKALQGPVPPTPPTQQLRREFLSTATLSIATAATMILLPTKSCAVDPLAENDLRKIEKSIWSVKAPVKLDRAKLDQDFAVYLIRSSYAEADQLDVIPLNQLERDMYLVRTTEYLPYADKIGRPIRQGDLTDPKYFDFMSAVQYVIINRAIQDPETSFDEFSQNTTAETGATIGNTTVHIERSLPDDVLASTHDARVGRSILDFLYDRYDQSTPFALPKAASGLSSKTTTTTTKPDITFIQKALSQLVLIFRVNGFARDGNVEIVQGISKNPSKATTTTFLFTLSEPASLWSSRVLAKQNAPVRNDYLLKTAKQLVQSLGYVVESSSVSIQGDKEISRLTIS